MGSPERAARLRPQTERQRGRDPETALARAGTESIEDLDPTIIGQGDRIVWPRVPGGAFPYNTGGSSGEPLLFHYGRRRQASDAAGRMRARLWWGVDVGDRIRVKLVRTDVERLSWKPTSWTNL